MIQNNRHKIVLLLLVVALTAVAQININKSYFLIWCSGGYDKLSNDAPETRALGGAGLTLGSGYEFHFKNILFQTGVELSSYSSKMILKDTLLVVPMVDTEGNPYTGHFRFRNTNDWQNVINISLPLMVGYESPNGFYCLGGGKLKLNLIANSIASTNVTSTAYYKALIGDNNDGILGDMPNHGLDSETRIVRSSFNLNTIFSATVETGYTFNNNPREFSNKNKPRVRLSIFYDFGFALLKKNDVNSNIFVNISNKAEYLPAIHGFLLNNINSNTFNLGVIGIKATILFETKKYRCNCTKF